MSKQNIKGKIEELKKIAKPDYHNMSCAHQESAIGEANVACDALKIIKELETIISIQENFIKSYVEVSEAKGDALPNKAFLKAMSILGRDVLEKTEQFLNGGENDKRK